MKFLSNILAKAGLIVDGTVTINSVANASTDTDRFIVIDNGVVKYRTGSQLRSDIDAASAAAGLPVGGAAGQILAKIDGTNYNTEWIDNYTTDLRQTVKAGEAINKGQAVYISGADGTNVIVSKASNASDATSSKTLGLLAQNLSNNGQGFVITEGKLTGINTSTAQAGDPVWLGTNGNLLFGLANKPVAPAHLVYLGVVTRANQNNGEIFVHVVNGFELEELHDVLIGSYGTKDVLWRDTATNLWKNRDIFNLIGAASGSANGYLTSTDWNTFNNKQNAIALTTSGSSGAATLNGSTLNIPQYTLAGLGGVPYTGAVSDVNLGNNDIYANEFIIRPTGYSTLAALGRDLTGSGRGVLVLRNGANATIQPSALSVDRTYNLPDESGTVLLNSRTITINGTTQDLSANRTWTIPSENVYNTDGSLTGNRTITLNGNFLDIAGNTKTRFFSNGNIAIGQSSPVDGGYKVDINGSLRVTGVGTGTAINYLVQDSAASEILRIQDNGTVTINKGALLANNSTVTHRVGLLQVTGATLNGLTTIQISSAGGQNVSFAGPSLFFAAEQLWNLSTFIPLNLVRNGVSFTANWTNSGAGIGSTGNAVVANISTSQSLGNNFLNNFAVKGTVATTGGNTTFRGFYYDPTITSSTGLTNIAFESTSGIVKISTLAGTGTRMVVADSSGVLSAQAINVGSVTSVGLTAPTGFAVSNSPITSSGDIALSFASGYSLPTTASQNNWDTAYNNRITSLTTSGTSGAATLANNTLNIPQYQAQGNYITSLTGEATASGPGAASVTLSNSAVTGKILSGLNVTGGTVVDTDSILTAFGKLQNQVNGLAGGVTYQGAWNASTNSPALTSSVGTKGYYYVVSVPGSTNLNGITDWKLGDWAIFNGTSWEKVDNTDAVVSVNGFTGAVSLTTSNITEGTSLYYTDARARAAISLTTNGDSGAATYSSGVFNIPQYTLSGLGGVVTSRTLTINGTAFDLSADRTFNVGTVTSVGLQVGTSGNDVNVSNSPITSSGSITLNIPSASATARGLITTGTQTIAGEKTFTSLINAGNIKASYYAFADINGFTTGIISESDRTIQVKIGSATAINVATNLNTTFSGNIIRSGGTSSQFLKADGSLDSNTYLTTGSASSTYVPYTGATGNVNIGNFLFSANNIDINGAFSAGGSLSFKQFNAATIGNTGYTNLFAVGTNLFGINYNQSSGVNRTVYFDAVNISNSTQVTYTLPNASGTLALTSNINSAVSGSTGQVAYFNGTNSVTGESNLFWDAANDRLGIGTATPGTRLHVVGGNVWSSNFYEIGRFQKTGPNVGLSFGYDNTSYTAAIGAYSHDGTASNLSFWTYPGSGAALERMRLDNSGNLGLGVTPSAWDSTARVLQIGSFVALANYTDYMDLSSNSFYDGQYKYLNSSRAASRYAQTGGQHQWFTAPSGTAGNAITFTQAMTLDASGRLGIGTPTPNAPLTVVGSGVTARFQTGSANDGRVEFAYNTTDVGYIAVPSSNEFSIWARTNNALLFGAGNTERMRITSGGNVLVGTQTDNGQRMQIAGGASTALRLDANSGVAALNIGAGATLSVDAAGVGGGRFLITSGGNVLVGTTTDAGQRLQVNGKTRSTEYISNSGSVSIAAGATATILNLATAQGNGSYTIGCFVGGGGLIYFAQAVFISNFDSGSYIKALDIYDGANVTLSISGSNVQITNNGFATFTWNWSSLYQPFN